MYLAIRPLLVGSAIVVVTPAFAQLDNLDEALRTTPITRLELAENFVAR